AGRDHAAALAALTELPARLPRDLDILLVALPTATSRAVVAAATALDHVLVVAERDRTSRVDLIASLEALSAAGTQAQVVLLDTPTAMRLAPPVMADPDDGSARRRGISSIVGTAPVVERGSDGDPVPVAEDEHPDDGTLSDADEVAAADDPPGAAEDAVPAQGEEGSPAPTEEPVAARAEDEFPARTEEPVAADVEEPIDRPASGEQPGAAEVEQERVVDGDALALAEAAESDPDARQDVPAGEAVDAELAADDEAADDEAADDEATGDEAADEERDVDPRDTAVLDAAAAATALAIADVQQGVTGELAPHIAEPRFADPDRAGDHDQALSAEGDGGAARHPSVQPSTDPAEQPLHRPHEGSPAEAVVQLDLGAEVRPGAREDDATDELPRVGSAQDTAAGRSREPGGSSEHTQAIAPLTPAGVSDPFEATDEDLLHTTARLAIITEDVLSREATDDAVAEEGDRATQDLASRRAHGKDPARPGDTADDGDTTDGDTGDGDTAHGDDRAAGDPEPGRDTGA
ncbi:MAG: hypothetical protein ACLFS9_10935, partial [Nitriliruptoraceae bacterium]